MTAAFKNSTTGSNLGSATWGAADGDEVQVELMESAQQTWRTQPHVAWRQWHTAGGGEDDAVANSTRLWWQLNATSGGVCRYRAEEAVNG